MDQTSRLNFDIYARDRASTTFDRLGSKVTGAHAALGKLGSSLSSLGGPFATLDQLTYTLSGSFDHLREHGKSFGVIMTATGLGLTGLGIALTGFASKEQASQAQLRAAISNTGHSLGDYSGVLDSTITQQEDFGHAASDTQDALNTLVTASQNPTLAFQDMGLAADIAAKKHENLAEAAQQLVLAEEGNTRGLKAFGVTLDGVGTKTQQIDRALRQLQDRMSGQASSAAETFGGRLKAVGTRLEDDLANLGKFGPAMTIAGAALTAVAAATQILAARRIADTAAIVGETAAQDALNVAMERGSQLSVLRGLPDLRSAGGMAAAEAPLVAGGLGLGSRFMRGGGIALGGYFASQLAGQAVGGPTGSYLSGIGGDAALGAGLGSIVPGLGTGFGAAAGGLVGLLNAFTSDHPSKLSASDQKLLAQLGKTSAGRSDLNKTLNEASGDSIQLTKATAAQSAALNKASKADIQAALTTGHYAQSLVQESDAATKAMQSLDGHIAALQASAKLGLDASAAQDGLTSAMHNLAQSIHDGSTALTGQSANALANRDALRNVLTQELSLIAALKAHHVGADKVRAASLAMSQAIERQAAAMGLDRAAVRRLIGEVGLLPAQIANALGATELLSEQVGEASMRMFAAGLIKGTPAAKAAATLGAAQMVKQMQFGSALDNGGTSAGSFVPKANDPGVKAAAKYAKKLADTVVSNYAPAVDTGVKKSTASAVDAAKQKLAQLVATAKQDAQTIEQAWHQVETTIADIGSLTNRTVGPNDSLGAPSYEMPSITGYLRSEADKLTKWARLYRRLDVAGLSPILLRQLEQLGIEAIPAMEEILKSGKRGIRRDNRYEARIQLAAGRVATIDTNNELNNSLHRLSNILDRLPSREAHAIERGLHRVHLSVSSAELDRKAGGRVRSAAA